MKKKILALGREILSYLPDAMSMKIRHMYRNGINIVLTSRKKVTGNTKFTIVSAVFNVSPYLDEYFHSLVNQTIDFKKQLTVILVDDGSTDDSADIIKKWQLQYPKNIIYIFKTNGGQASARNLGFKHVKTDWVTFIDPDDFIDLMYFEKVDSFLNNNRNVLFSMISCNTLLYYDKNGTYKNLHPLKYRFKNREYVVPSSNLRDMMQFSASSAFFRANLIQKLTPPFDERIKPKFEDGHFVGRYLLYDQSQKSFVAFLKEAKYFYRKRTDFSSSIDTSMLNHQTYNNVIKIGYIGLINEAKKINEIIPLYIQRMVLYDIFWTIKMILNDDNTINFLSSDKIKEYKKLTENLFQNIDSKTIENFNLAGCWFYHKVGLLGYYKHTRPSYHIVYIDDYDNMKNEVKLRYLFYFKCKEQFTLNDQTITPRYAKTRTHKFIGDTFVYEEIIWLPLGNKYDYLNVHIDGKKASITLANKKHKDGIQVSEIIKHSNNRSYSKQAYFSLKYAISRRIFNMNYFKEKYGGAWLLLDRDTQADDNAEHLYRYLKEKHKETISYFILQKKSHDWERLKKEGFNLIPFGSLAHRAALTHAKHLISSHADNYVVNYLPRKHYGDLLNYKFTFLQHGIIKDDLSDWLNKKHIDCFITTSRKEYESIAGNNTSYKFTKKEVALTGLARHDSLLANDERKERLILIMPTWRQSVARQVKGNINCTQNDSFSSSPYVTHWKELINSTRLSELCHSSGYHIVFFPHVYMQSSLESLNVPKYIEIQTHATGSIQQLFKRASLLITDYSSVAFEMGILRRQVIYFQFDHDDIYNGQHTYNKGYFDYHNDGFGPTCTNIDDVLDELDVFLELDGKTHPKYIKRMQDFFTFHDTNNCSRVFDAINSL